MHAVEPVLVVARAEAAADCLEIDPELALLVGAGEGGGEAGAVARRRHALGDYRRERGMDEPAARALMERQWSPETNPNKDAPTWTRFIAGEER